MVDSNRLKNQLTVLDVLKKIKKCCRIQNIRKKFNQLTHENISLRTLQTILNKLATRGLISVTKKGKFPFYQYKSPQKSRISVRRLLYNLFLKNKYVKFYYNDIFQYIRQQNQHGKLVETTIHNILNEFYCKAVINVNFNKNDQIYSKFLKFNYVILIEMT